jgi:hypothetical protein
MPADPFSPVTEERAVAPIATLLDVKVADASAEAPIAKLLKASVKLAATPDPIKTLLVWLVVIVGE